MSIAQSIWSVTATACATLCLASLAKAADEFNPTPTFAIETREALGLTPQDVILSNGFIYVLGSDGDGLSAVEMRDAQTLELLQERKVKAEITDIVADQKTGDVYAIGTAGGATRFQVMDSRLNPLGSAVIKPILAQPSLTTSSRGLVAVSGIDGPDAEGFFAAVDVSKPERPVLREEFFSLNARRGVLNGWLVPEQGTIFLNTSWDSRLAAVATGKSYLMSEFSVETASGSLSEPYAISAAVEDELCRNGAPTSFLVADMSRNVLSLVDFDASFQSLDLLSVVEFNLPQSGPALPVWEGTLIREPSGVIASACDQSVILLGSTTSNQVAQFARNANLATLERVGTVRLPGRPTAIAVDEFARFAIVVSAENRAVMRLSNQTDQTPIERVIGDPEVRELQRTLTEIGIPVGSIDGILGAKTKRAVDLANKKYNLDIDADRELQEAVETLKKVFK